MSPWRVRCKECGNVWVLNVSYDLDEFTQLYHYCRVCGKNTYHEILEYSE